MEVTMISIPVSASTFVAALSLIFLSLYFITTKIKARNVPNLPPGSFGWPLLGETLEFQRLGRDGKPEDFVRERMNKYDSRIFKTSFLGEPMAVFCGPAGNKFLYGNENKLVAQWWPTSVQKLFGRCLVTAAGDEAKRIRKMLMTFLSPDALVRYITTMDVVTQHHIRTQWEVKQSLILRDLREMDQLHLHMFHLEGDLGCVWEKSLLVLKFLYFCTM